MHEKIKETQQLFERETRWRATRSFDYLCCTLFEVFEALLVS